MKKVYLLLISIALLLSSCNQKEKQCKETIKSFFKEIKNENPDGMKKFYPNVDKLRSYYKSDSVIIKEVKKEADDKYVVEVNNIYTNGFGKKFDRDMTLYLKPVEDERKMIIYDSKGMFGLKDNKEYAYAKRHGDVTDKHKTDVQISEAVSAAMTVPYSKVLEIERDLGYGNLVQGRINWQMFYGSGHGNFIVKNTYDIRLENLKYTVHFSVGSDGPEITQDEGYVKVGDLMPGESTSVSFYASYIGKANWARVTLHINEDDLLEAVLEE